MLTLFIPRCQQCVSHTLDNSQVTTFSSLDSLPALAMGEGPAPPFLSFPYLTKLQSNGFVYVFPFLLGRAEGHHKSHKVQNVKDLNHSLP